MKIEDIIAMNIPKNQRIEFGVKDGLTYISRMGWYLRVDAMKEKIYVLSEHSSKKKSEKAIKARLLEYISLLEIKTIREIDGKLEVDPCGPTYEITGSNLPDYQTKPEEELSDVHTNLQTQTLPGGEIEVIARLELLELSEGATTELPKTDYHTETQWPLSKKK